MKVSLETLKSIMSTVSVYNRSMLVDMVTADSEYQNNLSANSALSTSPKGNSKTVPQSFKSRSTNKGGKRGRKTGAPGRSMSKADMEQLRRSRLTAQRSSMLLDVEKEIAKRKQEAEERIKRVRQKKENQFANLWHEVTAGEGCKLHLEWEQRLRLHDKEQLLKKQRLHTEWTEQVYQPIDKKIKNAVKHLQESGIHEVRQKEYQNYLDAVALKGRLFLDEVDEAEYNPYVPNAHVPKVKASVIDPTKQVFNKAKEEMAMVPGGGDAPSHRSKPGRYMLEITKWGSGTIESTPHGHFAKMLEADEGGRELPKNSATSRTLKPGYINHFKVPTGKEVMDKEWKAVNGKGVGMNAKPADTLKIS